MEKEISISVENNNYYKTEAYDYVTDPDFISSIVYDNDINFLFDISHARISAYNSGVDYCEYLLKLPLNRVNQIHIFKRKMLTQMEKCLMLMQRLPMRNLKKL